MPQTIKVSPVEMQVYNRLKDKGDFIYNGVGNLFWANTNHKGALIEALTDEEKDALWKLESKGLIKKETKSMPIY